MRFFWVIILFGSHLLSAASVAVITQDNASFYTNCSAGTIYASPCPPGNPDNPGGIDGPFYHVEANAGRSSYTPPTSIPGGTIVSIGAEAQAYYLCSPDGPCPPLIPISAAADASETISGYTKGPSRVGSIQVSLDVAVAHGFLPYFLITDGTNVYENFGDGWGCCGGMYEGTLPFNLGGPFSVSATTPSVGGGCDGSNSQCGEGDSADAAISFVFLEPDGSAIPFESRITPEPGPWALCALGLAFAIPRFRRRRR